MREERPGKRGGEQSSLYWARIMPCSLKQAGDPHCKVANQEKSDGLPARLSPSLCGRPGRSAAGVEEESCLQEGLDEDGDGGQQLEQLELGLGEVVGEEGGKGNQAGLTAHSKLTGEEKNAIQVDACPSLREPESSHLAARNEGGKSSDCVKSELRSGR